MVPAFIILPTSCLPNQFSQLFCKFDKWIRCSCQTFFYCYIVNTRFLPPVTIIKKKKNTKTKGISSGLKYNFHPNKPTFITVIYISALANIPLCIPDFNMGRKYIYNYSFHSCKWQLCRGIYQWEMLEKSKWSMAYPKSLKNLSINSWHTVTHWVELNVCLQRFCALA